MRKLLVLGAGTAGTMVVNKMSHHLDPDEWDITIVDREETHYYQPGFLFIPFGIYGRNDVIKPKRDYIPSGVKMINSEIELVEPENNRVKITEGDRWLDYDYLVIATGTHPRLDETPGLEDEDGNMPDNVHTFYTLDGACRLKNFLRSWKGGKMVMNIMEMPFKCPVAPLEFTFLADWWFTEQGMRDRVEIEYVTPLPGAFTKPVASKALGGMLEERKVSLVSDFMVESVDAENNKLVAFDEEEVEYDLLVTVPVNMGADFVGRSGLGDELNHVPVDKREPSSRPSTTTSSRWATRRTSPPRRPVRWRTSPSTSGRRTSSGTSTGSRWSNSSTAMPTASSRAATARVCSSTSTTTRNLCRASIRCRALGRSRCCRSPR